MRDDEPTETSQVSHVDENDTTAFLGCDDYTSCAFTFPSGFSLIINV